MNNYPIYFNNNYYFNIQNEINILKEKINILEEKIKLLENNKNNYLEKDDNYYVI